MILENQIKNFIQMIIKVVLEQVTAFVVNPRNQVIYADFVRTVIGLLLKEPLAHYAAELNETAQDKMISLINAIMGSKKLFAYLQHWQQTICTDLYQMVKDKKISHYVKLEGDQKMLFEELLPIIILLLKEPVFVAFLESELKNMRKSS